MQRVPRPTLASQCFYPSNLTSKNIGLLSNSCASSKTLGSVATLLCTRQEQVLATRRIPAYKRSFSQTSSIATPKPDLGDHAPSGPIPEYAFTIQPNSIASSHASRTGETLRSSSIRQSLRAWSVQNEKAKRDALPNTLPYEGKLTKIPNSLFLGLDRTVEEETDIGYNEEVISNEDFPDGSSHHYGDLMKPGTLMHHQSSLISPQDVVYLGEIGTQSLLLLFDGRWAAENLRQKRDTISNMRHHPIKDFLTPEDMNSLTSYMPKTDVTRALDDGLEPQPVDVIGSFPENVFAPIAEKIRAFNDAYSRFLRLYEPQLHNMYDKLALENEWRPLSIADVSSLILGTDFGSMTDIAKKVLVAFAAKHHPLLVPYQTAGTLSYNVGPKSLNASVMSVQAWSRQYQEAAAQAALGKPVMDQLQSNPLAAFIDKARRIILKSRKIRSPTLGGMIVPLVPNSAQALPRKVRSGEVFTSDDKKIISYLWDVAMRRPISVLPQAHASLIVRAIGAYPNMELKPLTFRLLLTELGCVDPWTIYEDFTLPLLGTKQSSQLEAARREAMASTVGFMGKNKATTFADSMAHMRKDWAETEAICIDAFSTTNVEDALSIEPATEIQGGYWLHCHFSHPTAHLETQHPVVRAARKFSSAYYSLVDGELPQTIVPFEVIDQFALKPDSAVLTVSTLMSPDGQVHDVKMVPGVIRNVKRVDRDVVAHLMNRKEPEKEAILVVGKVAISNSLSVGRRISSREIEAVSPLIPRLKLMRDILNARRNRRKQEVETPARFFRRTVPVQVRAVLPEKYKVDREFESYHWEGDPGIILRGPRKMTTDETFDMYQADDPLTQAMRLASESMGRWLAERNIPAVFLGNPPPPFSIDYLNEHIPHTGMSTPLWTRTTFPRPTYAHNMKQYAGCTSPMRKFSDMLTHFQVDSYLRAEAKGLIQRGAVVTDDRILAYSKEDIESYLMEDVATGDALDDHQREHTHIWIGHALFRAFHLKEAVLPDIMEVMIHEPARRNAHGLFRVAIGSLIPWGIKAAVLESAEGYERMAKYREFIPVRLVEIDPGTRVARTVAVGPPTTEQQILDPIQSYTSANFDDAVYSNDQTND